MKVFQHTLRSLAAFVALAAFSLTLQGCSGGKDPVKAQEKSSEAIAILETLMANKGKDEGGEYDKAAAEKDMAAADKLLKEAMSLDPTFDKPVCATGTLYRIKEEYAEAAKWYKKAIKLNPEYVVAWDGLGFVQIKMQQLDEAEKSLNTALKFDKENRASIHWNLALLYKERGDAKNEAKHLRHFLERELDTESGFYKEAEKRLDTLK